MPSITTSFQTIGIITQALGADWDTGELSKALTSNDQRAIMLPVIADYVGITDYIVATNTVTKLPVGAIIRGFEAKIECLDSDTEDRTSVQLSPMRLVRGGVIVGDTLTALSEDITTEDAVYTHGSSTTLAGLSHTVSSVNASDFGLAAAFEIDQTGGGTGLPEVDHISLVIHYDIGSPHSSSHPEQSGDRQMDTYNAAEHGGFTAVKAKALPSVSSSAQIFQDAPKGLAWIELTIAVAPLNIEWTGQAATTSVGNTYSVGTHILCVGKNQALKARAIENGGTVTGYITYWVRGKGTP